ncbi:MAG TPA: IS110 family transposase [Dongiaceae bacterium]|nr:IS110 family transposase [Dongiaceae bacterium]
MDAPWGVCAIERQVQGSAKHCGMAHGREELDMEHQRCWLVGIDWASEEHQVHVTDAAGAKRGARSFRHDGAGLAAMAEWILKVTGAQPQDIHVAIETPHGPVVESLMERGFHLHAINPKQLDRFRDRFSPAGAKDDSRDAEVLASALRTDPQCLRPLDPVDPTVLELRECSRIADELTQERVRLANRLREQLWRYYPQMIEVAEDLAADWVLELWKLVPTPAAARRVREQTVARLLKQHRIRRTSAPDLLERLRAPAITVAPGTTEAAGIHINSLIRRLVVINRELRAIRAKLDRMIERLTQAGDTEPGQQPEQRDVAILASSPGAGRITIATLLAEAWNALQRRDYHALRCLCGVAPVTRQSGKSKIVVRRLAVSRRLQNAAYNWAFAALQYDPRSRAKYDSLRQRGHGHARALRSVADRLLAMLCAMLRTQTLFDPNRHAKAAAA